MSLPAVEFVNQSPARVEADAVVVFAAQGSDAAEPTADARAAIADDPTSMWQPTLDVFVAIVAFYREIL